MNKERRAQIEEAQQELQTLRQRIQEGLSPADWQDVDAIAANVTKDVGAILAAEQEAYDNMPEGFQLGERGEAAQNAIEHLRAALDMMTPPPSLDKATADKDLYAAVCYLHDAAAC